MTKTVRIENADTSGYRIQILTQELRDGVWVDADYPKKFCDHPASQVLETVHSGKRLIVQECGESEYDYVKKVQK